MQAEWTALQQGEASAMRWNQATAVLRVVIVLIAIWAFVKLLMWIGNRGKK